MRVQNRLPISVDFFHRPLHAKLRILISYGNFKMKLGCPIVQTNGAKDSFLRALKEVAPEMELFLENHGQYMKNFVIKLNSIQSCTFYKKIVS